MKDKDQHIASIDRFLADNPEFEDLSARLSQFNVFRALNIEKVEIRHSNVLAWLLDPDESHGFSNIVLRRLLSNILLMSDKTIKGLSAAKVELLDFSDIEVLREWKNIDLLIIDRLNRIILFFENKIHSGESTGQLAKYKRIVEDEFPQFTIIPVFLTLTGQESSDKDAQDYISYSHTQLYAMLSTLFVQRKSQLAEPVQVFMQHYLDTLRRLTMQDEELTNLCKTIYRKHREAIDLIVEYGMVSTFSQAAEDVLGADGKYEILSSSPSQFWFLPNSWKSLIPENAIVSSWVSTLKRTVSICCWFEYYKGKLYSHFEACKMDDPALRLECVKSLKAAGFILGKKAFDDNATYSRFYGKTVKIKDETDYDEMSSAIKKLLEKAKPEFSKAETVFKDVFKNTKLKK
jgi:hypothetical protein